MGLDEGRVTDRILGLTHTQQLTALGNGVLPRQAAEAFRRRFFAWLDSSRHRPIAPMPGVPTAPFSGRSSSALLEQKGSQGTFAPRSRYFLFLLRHSATSRHSHTPSLMSPASECRQQSKWSSGSP